MHVRLGLASGGAWAYDYEKGYEGGSMIVDYVRTFKLV